MWPLDCLLILAVSSEKCLLSTKYVQMNVFFILKLGLTPNPQRDKNIQGLRNMEKKIQIQDESKVILERKTRRLFYSKFEHIIKLTSLCILILKILTLNRHQRKLGKNETTLTAGSCCSFHQTQKPKYELLRGSFFVLIISNSDELGG